MCELCGKNCKRKYDEFGTGELVCQFCDICNQNDHDECDCTNICMEFYTGCRNPKIEDSPFCIYCQALNCIAYCAGVNDNACGDIFSEEYPPESTSFEIKYGHQFVKNLCFTCNFRIELENGNIQLEDDIIEEA
jgi:hypothetical protein